MILLAVMLVGTVNYCSRLVIPCFVLIFDFDIELQL